MIYYDLKERPSKVVSEDLLITIVTYEQIPLIATVLCQGKKYKILQHTSQWNKLLDKELYVYIAEETI